MKKVLFLGVLLALPSIVFAHPVDGLKLNPLDPAYEETYGSRGAEISLGEIRFPASFPARETLTDAEKFIIAGLDPVETGLPHHNYINMLFRILDAYYARHQEVPAVLSEQIIRDALSSTGGKPVDQAVFDFLKSPITGEYPRLDCASFQRGQLYVERLTFPQVLHVSKDNLMLTNLYFHKKVYNGSEWVPGQIAGQVFYIRAYGESETILAGLQYASISNQGLQN